MWAPASVDGRKLGRAVRKELPGLSILYVKNEDQPPGPPPEGLPADVPTLAEPFTDKQLLEAVRLPLGRDE